MTARTPDVFVADVGADAATVTSDGRLLLVLRPGQSLSSAVRATGRCLPWLHPDQIRRIVRQALPGATDFQMDSAEESLPLPLTGPPVRQRRRGRQLLPYALAVAGLLTAAAGWTVSAHRPDRPPSAVDVQAAQAGADPARLFDGFAPMGVHCTPLGGGWSARCVDSKGTVMLGEVAVNPEQTLYSLAYGDDRIIVRRFGTAQQAAEWAAESATARVDPHVQRSGRWVMYGSDDARIAAYLRQMGPQAG